MRLLFVDGTYLEYTPLTPWEQPLGGMQSALCYLATALATRGHNITLLNRGNRTPGTYAGIFCAGFDALDRIALNGFDAVISISTGSVAFRQMGLRRPLVLWSGHDVDQRAVESLHDGTERYLWDKIILVSNWQVDRYCATFKVRREQVSVLQNAIALAFEKLSLKKHYFFESGRPPVLFYSSTPYRGLNVLLSAFPLIRALVPGCEARIYSSMTVNQTPPEQDAHRALYDRCRAIEGVHYVGSLGQAALAQAMADLDIFAYPSTFAETSCIALMEAMAAGTMVLSAAVGALPETAAGFGNFCDRPPNSSESQFAELYARFAAHTIQDAYKNPKQYSARIDEQRAFALQRYSWAERAVEWEKMLASMFHQPVRTITPKLKELCPCGSGLRFKRCCGASA